MAGDVAYGLPHLLSFSFFYIDRRNIGEQIDGRGFAVDSGFACNSANMEPSHVLAAMGIITHGNGLTLDSTTANEEM